MKIAFITYEYPPDTGKGGIGTYIMQIAPIMKSYGWNVHVFAGSHTRSLSEVMESYSIHRVKCNDPVDFRTKVIKAFEIEHIKNPFDLIESPEIHGNAWEIKKKNPELPLIVRLHAPDYLVEKFKKKHVPFFVKLRFVLGAFRRLKFDLGYWRPYNKLSDADYQFIQTANYITAPSQAMKKWAINNWQISPDDITVIPNVFFPPQALLNIPIFEELTYKRILFFGRLNVLKGLVNATKAMKKILNKYPDWIFRIIGDDGAGPTNKINMRSWMKLQLKDVINQVEFIDSLSYDQMPSAIGSCEIVILPSLFESFSYTCAEAMAAGKAVVGSKVGGMADLIQHNKNGLLINPNSHTDIYKEIRKLIHDNSYRYQVSIKARERISLDFNAPGIALQFNDFYKKVILKQFAKN